MRWNLDRAWCESIAIVAVALLVPAVFGLILRIEHPALLLTLVVFPGIALGPVGLAANAIWWVLVMHRVRIGQVQRLERVGTLVMLSIGAVFYGSAAPGYLGSKEKSRFAICDNLFVALNGAVAEELDAFPIASQVTPADLDAVVELILDTERIVRNPRNREQPAYTRDDPAACQVRLRPAGSSGIEFAQRPTSGVDMRTFSVQLR